MANNSSPFAPIPSLSPHHHSKSRKLLLYYGMAVVGTISIILAVYNIMVLRWCAIIRRHMPPQQAARNFEPSSSTSRSFDDPNSQIALCSKYKKEQGLGQDQGQDHECSVCLSHFEEGDEVRQLQKCKHYFHIPCIDTWLSSHLDCPVCRAPVRSPILWHHVAADRSDNSREVLLLSSMPV